MTFSHTAPILDETSECIDCGEYIQLENDVWVDNADSAYCQNHYSWCGACDDGEPHPHEPGDSHNEI